MEEHLEAELSWLEDPEVFRVGRLDAHSDHHFYETKEDMRRGNETLRQSLNGTWKFYWSRSPRERPMDFFQKGADLSQFGEIQVPGHMELQGYGRVHYVNTMYPWEGHSYLRPPRVDQSFNPVGSYVKEFDLEPGLTGKRVCISFQGAEQAVFVWLNGSFIGYAEDTFTPSEFDLTGAVREKGNRLCVEVYKRSSAGWLEDQDFFRFSGLFREVYLYAKPEIHVEDLWIKAGVLEDYATGTLEMEAKLSGKECEGIGWELLDRNGNLVRSGAFDGFDGGEKTVRSGAPKEERAAGRPVTWRMSRILLPGIALWDVGSPNLYQIVLYVKGAGGKTVEIVPYRAGFRRFEMRDRIMLLNGRRLMVHGVNRHEWNPDRGRAIAAEDMRRDIEIMRRNHINAVRTCHYPDQSLWYQLCDEAGICVMDETNLESHGSWQKMGQCEPSWNIPGSRPEWEACVLDRAVSMLERDKNHPSVLWWSCGNEAYAGECIRSMSRYFHEKDPSRLVHYEGVFWNREFEDISDVESRMYASPEEVRRYLENDPKKPFLLCEYMHDMGNSIGGMGSYMKLFDEFPMYQGGFIWDYIDQAVCYKNPYGEKVLGYGGDFGDRPTDYAFSANGLLFADRTEKPAMQEVRYWYAPPQERQASDAANRAGLKDAVRRLKDARETEDAAGCLQVVHGDLMLGIRGDGFEIIFSYQEGPVSLVYNGRECLYRAPRPAFWRACTENDRGNRFAVKSAQWLGADQFSACTRCDVTEYAGERVISFDPQQIARRDPAGDEIERVSVKYAYVTPTVPETEAHITYTVHAGGRIRVDLHYHGKEGLPELPIFGLRLVMPEYEEKMTWQGLSGETYPDRMAGGRFGVHEGRTEVPPYLVPQECGNHMQTCWMQVGALRIEMDGEPFAFSALPYTAAELESASHREELPRPSRTVITLPARMRGVGGIDSWGADVEGPYHVSGEEDITFSFYITKTKK